MIIYPAIDLIGGKCVRLELGDFDKKTTYDLNPIDIALSYKAGGAEWVHIIDLDGAKKGSPQQLELIVELKEISQLKVQTGGGIRHIDEAIKVLESGIDRVIIGSLAVAKPNIIQKLINQYGAERVVLAMDVKIENDTPYIATHGWTHTTDLTLNEALSQFLDFGAKHILVTDISRDGLLEGPNLELYETLSITHSQLHIQASGGVASLDDIKTLRENKSSGAIVGKALYENIFNIHQAINEAAEEEEIHVD